MERIDIIGMGDSITWGYPFGPKVSWFNLAAEAAGLKFVNKGISGETTEQMLERFERSVVRLAPRYVTIMGGTNDAWAGISVYEVETYMKEMVKKAAVAGIESVIVQPPPLCKGAGEISGEFIEEMAGFLYNYRQAYERIALSYQLKLLDLYTPMLDRATGWGSTDCYIDEAHPSRKGYQVMAAVAADFFKKL